MNKNIMKKLLFTLGSVSVIAAPVAAVVACTDGEKYVDPMGSDVHNLTSSKPASGVWHPLFRDAQPKAGDKFGVQISGNSYIYTWEAGDTVPGELTSAFVKTLSEKIAAHPVDGAPAVTWEKVAQAMGFSTTPTSNHKASIPSPVVTTVTTPVTPQVTQQPQAPANTGSTGTQTTATVAPKEVTIVALGDHNGQTFWHPYFANAQYGSAGTHNAPVEGEKWTIGSFSATWTKAELDALKGSTSTTAAFKTILDKFVAENPGKEAEIVSALGLDKTSGNHNGMGVFYVAPVVEHDMTSKAGNMDAWHALFNPYKIKIGEKIVVTVGGDKLEMTWSAADDAFYKANTPTGSTGGNHQKLVEHIADAMKGTHTVTEVMTAMGFVTNGSTSTMHHVQLPVVTPAAKEWTLGSQTQWHALFRATGMTAHFEGKEGEILKITTTSGDLRHVLTASDITTLSTFASGGQNAAVNAITQMFISDDSTKTSEINNFFSSSVNYHSVTIA